MNFEEAYKDLSEDVKKYGRMFLNVLKGREIVDFEYGPDADGDPHLYYMVLDNGIKIGMARVFPDGKVVELDRKEKYSDGSIIRFQFHKWPEHCPKCHSIKIDDICPSCGGSGGGIGYHRCNRCYGKGKVDRWECTECGNTWSKEVDPK